jgi:hypothetical protein
MWSVLGFGRAGGNDLVCSILGDYALWSSVVLLTTHDVQLGVQRGGLCYAFGYYRISYHTSSKRIDALRGALGLFSHNHSFHHPSKGA